jgi:integrase/recombinase XerD
VGVGRAADLEGAAHLVLADGVVHLDPAQAVFEAMLEGWARQQRTRFLKWDSTIKPFRPVGAIREDSDQTGAR